MKILLIDDHDLFRDGIKLVLANLDADIEILSANSYENALPLMLEHQDLDIILLDLGLPGLCDINALEAVRSQLPSTPVVVLSGNDDRAKVQQMLNMGAQGYIPKSTNSSVLLQSLKLVLSGGIYVPPEILPQLSNNVGYYSPREQVDTPLTPRQYDVLGKLIHGYSNKEIGDLLQMAESTVRVHIAAILKKLNVSNRTRAAHLAVQKGWISIEQEQ